MERAVVEPTKIRDYLLSASHPVGRFKAQFFVALGYSQERWEVLAADLKRHAEVGIATEREISPYGQKIVSIWMILRGMDARRLITACPG